MRHARTVGEEVWIGIGVISAIECGKVRRPAASYPAVELKLPRPAMWLAVWQSSPMPCARSRA